MRRTTARMCRLSFSAMKRRSRFQTSSAVTTSKSNGQLRPRPPQQPLTVLNLAAAKHPMLESPCLRRMKAGGGERIRTAASRFCRPLP
jgi:hypothetical protein